MVPFSSPLCREGVIGIKARHNIIHHLSAFFFFNLHYLGAKKDWVKWSGLGGYHIMLKIFLKNL